MELEAIQRATQRLADAAAARADGVAAAATLERAQARLESLAETAAALESTLPERLAEAFRAEALPVGRQLAEVRGLTGNVVRTLERVEGQIAAERHARVDDLALLVDLVASGWKSVDARLRRMEEALEAPRIRAA